MDRPDPYDLLVIGGGINGAGIARDAAMRGLRVCLVEKEDWGWGTSSKSSMLAHGGLRYLEQFEFGLVHEALQDRELMFRQAPHLVRPLRFIYPIYPHVASRRTVHVGLWLYDVLSHGKSVPRRQRLDPAQVLDEVPGLEPRGLTAGAAYHDGQFQSVQRFVWELVLSARRHGADCHNHTRVDSLLIKDGTCRGAVLGDGTHIHATCTINAAGPWVDDILDGHVDAPPLIRATKGIHLAVPRLANTALIVRAQDGRTFFFTPWKDHTLIGTTDTDFSGDPGQARADADDVAYLMEAARRYFPGADLDIRFTYAGVRPLVHQEGLTESNVTRKHRLRDHRKDGASSLWSVQGGKLTTYRHLSEEAVDLVCRRLGHARHHPTREGTLPGGPLVPWETFRPQAIDAAIQAGVPTHSAAHLIDTYGAMWRQVIDGASDDLLPVTPGAPHLWCEVRHAVLHEDATHLADVMLRRTDLGLAADGRIAVAQKVARRMADWLAWSSAQRRRQVAAYQDQVRVFEVPQG